MDDKKKKYVTPKAEKVDFCEEDILTTSGLRAGGYLEEDVGGGDNLEDY